MEDQNTDMQQGQNNGQGAQPTEAPVQPVVQTPAVSTTQATENVQPVSPVQIQSPLAETTQTMAPQTQQMTQNEANQTIAPQTTTQNVPVVSMEEKLFAMFSYIILVSVFTLLLKPKSAFVRLHGRQGLVMTIFFFLSFFVIIVPFIGAPLTTLVVLAIFAINVFSMYQSLMGNWWKIPAIGDIAEMIPMTLFENVSKEAVGAITGSTPTNSETMEQDQTPPENNPPSATPPVQPS